MLELILLEEKLRQAKKDVNKALKIQGDLTEKINLLKKKKAQTETLSEKALQCLEGYSRDKLYTLLDLYFEVMETKSIVGKVMITDMEGVKKDKTVYDTIIIECGGKAIYDLLHEFEEKTVDEDGETLYNSSGKNYQKRQKARKLFNRRMRHKPVLEKLLQYGKKCDTGLKDHAIY